MTHCKQTTPQYSHSLAALLFVALVVITAFPSCGRKMSEADLQQKIDSVLRVENLEQLTRQGINLSEANPLEAFYDSLAVQPLPLTSDESYVAMESNFTVVPQELAAIMGLDTGNSTRLIALPESLGTRLILELVSRNGEDKTLWLYSLGIDFMPVDKIMLYSTDWESKITDGEQEINFSITSNYEVRVVRYLKEEQAIRQVRYVVAEDRTFSKSVEEVKPQSPYKNF